MIHYEVSTMTTAKIFKSGNSQVQPNIGVYDKLNVGLQKDATQPTQFKTTRPNLNDQQF